MSRIVPGFEYDIFINKSRVTPWRDPGCFLHSNDQYSTRLPASVPELGRACLQVSPKEKLHKIQACCKQLHLS